MTTFVSLLRTQSEQSGACAALRALGYYPANIPNALLSSPTYGYRLDQETLGGILHKNNFSSNYVRLKSRNLDFSLLTFLGDRVDLYMIYKGNPTMWDFLWISYWKCTMMPNQSKSKDAPLRSYGASKFATRFESPWVEFFELRLLLWICFRSSVV